MAANGTRSRGPGYLSPAEIPQLRLDRFRFVPVAEQLAARRPGARLR
jgi:hypothetical protein